MDDLYPKGPQNVPADLARPNGSYRRHAWLAVASLVLFVVLYLALAAWFVWTAYRMFGEAAIGGPNAMLQAGVGGGAAFFAVFMLKSLFFTRRGGAPDAVEVTEAEQPRLFAFLYRLADEAGAPRPKRVFLSPRVNAAVFYDLTIFNLLFPSRKNLEIGMALVNVLTLSELKAVLAHEFGHFAQRSMAIGSWVYIAQQIASQIINKRDALDKFINALSRFDLRIAWVGWLLSLVVWSLRSLMDTLLRLVVLAQRALSRQMEFQADLVSVSLTGSDELVHALHKLQAADDAWSRGLDFANAELRQGRIPHDLFEVQTRIIEKTARIIDDENYGAVPQAEGPAEAFRVFRSGFAKPPQMWETHPANDDREENAKRTYLPAPHDGRSAWLLFDDVEGMKTRVSACLLAGVEGEPASAEQTRASLDDHYALVQYEPRYRGTYLGRALTRHAASPAELIGAGPAGGDPAQALAGIYPPALSKALTKLGELEQERVALQALRERIYQPTGGKITYRGREIARRELPAAINEVKAEEEALRQKILEHDRRCRSAHLRAAEIVGGGWREYLTGLVRVLHYAEHTQADLLDAHGVLNNVLAVVTAHGKVSSRELKRLITTANMLHKVLARIYCDKEAVQLDTMLQQRLEVASWAGMLEEFKLAEAGKANINSWMNVIDGWVGAASSALSSLRGAALEQLLASEDTVARHLREGSEAEAAPSPSQVPAEYPVLLPGQERKRQKRLGLWDRFLVADGVFGTFARLLVAVAIVGSVLGIGSYIGTTAELSIYNGLDTTVNVAVGRQHLELAPFQARQIEISASKPLSLQSRTADGRLIETFAPHLSGHAVHYVYNVASASPLVVWTATYGSAYKPPPRFLGAPRWATESVDVYFSRPPHSVETDGGGGALRTVLVGIGDRRPSVQLKLARNVDERRRIIIAHATWDKPDSPHADQWKQLAARLN